MKLNTCLLACAVRVSLRRAFKRICLYLMSYISLRSRFNFEHVCLCFAAQGRCGKPEPQELKIQGEWSSAVRKAKHALLLESCLAFFMAHPSCFVGNMHISELQPCLPGTVCCSHVVVLALRGTTADTSLSCNNSHPSKSSWLQYINPFFSCLWTG